MNRNEFHQAIEVFYNETRACSNELKWTLVTDSRYKYLKQYRYLPIKNGDNNDVIEGEEQTLQEEISDPATVNTYNTTTATAYTYLTMEYHIVYSPSYQVPVLYFNGYNADGCILPLNDLYQWVIAKETQDNLKHGNRLSSQGSISQEEHPILGFPFYYIHPCETQSMMRSVSHDIININTFIKTWLSFIGPTIQCTLSHQLFV